MSNTMKRIGDAVKNLRVIKLNLYNIQVDMAGDGLSPRLVYASCYNNTSILSRSHPDKGITNSCTGLSCQVLNSNILKTF